MASSVPSPPPHHQPTLKAPRQITFQNVVPGAEPLTANITLTNPLDTKLSFTLHTSNPSRYRLSSLLQGGEGEIILRPGESIEIALTLRLAGHPKLKPIGGMFWMDGWICVYSYYARV